MTAPAPVNLGSHMRGDGFQMTFTLENEWLGVNFDEVWFTVRTEIPSSATVTDTDAIAQVTLTGGGITFDPLDDTVGTAVIEADVTTTWPAKRLHWDLQGGVDGDPKSPYTIGRGTLTVVGDVTRST